jgi:hypothetical protein
VVIEHQALFVIQNDIDPHARGLFKSVDYLPVNKPQKIFADELG